MQLYIYCIFLVVLPVHSFSRWRWEKPFCEEGDIERQTTNGPVIGREDGDGQYFRGITYATAERWEHAKDPTPWTTAAKTQEFGPMCEQPKEKCNRPSRCSENNAMSEDCLTINIFAPKCTSVTSRVPVLAWIHSGSYLSYTASSTDYDGLKLAQKGKIIVVTFNYRLGAFGNLKISDDINGNYGFLDQRKALLWIQNNIENFGGDPDMVTLAGDSAGGHSVITHLMTSSQDLFSQVILSSLAGIPHPTALESQANANDIAKQLNCTDANKSIDVECLKSKTGAEISTASENLDPSPNYFHNFMPFAPYIDGEDITKDFFDSAEEAFELRRKRFINRNFFDSDEVNGKRFLLGFSSYEALQQTYKSMPNPLPAQHFAAVIAQWRPTIASKVAERYIENISSGADVRSELSAFMSDILYICPTRFIANNLPKSSRVWMYVFNHPVKESYQNPPSCQDRPCHSDDLPYIFGHKDLINTYGGESDELLNEDDDTLIGNIIDYFSAFVKYGSPNDRIQYTKNWMEYRNDRDLKYFFPQSILLRMPSDLKDELFTKLTMELKEPGMGMIPEYRKAACEFWDEIGYKQSTTAAE